MNAEETKREKARALRYKKPIVRDLNLMSIKETLYDIQEECESVRWFTDTEEETLINSLGSEDQAYEFRMMFADLCAETERMLCDLEDVWVPKCFDTFFVTAGAGDSYGGLLGYDNFEQDYFGLDCSYLYAEDEAKKTLKRMTKDELIDASRQCFKIYQSFIALSYRYDCLKNAMDILKSENTDYLQVIKQINDLYEKVDKESYGFQYDCKEEAELDNLFDCLPQEAWVQ